MNMPNPIKIIKQTLTPEQFEYYKGIQWLINTGPKRSGRSFVLAMAFIEQAIYLQIPIKVWDHTVHCPTMSFYILIQQIAQTYFPDIRLKINTKQQTIQIIHNNTYIIE
jgi:hypothetical protein